MLHVWTCYASVVYQKNTNIRIFAIFLRAVRDPLLCHDLPIEHNRHGKCLCNVLQTNNILVQKFCGKHSIFGGYQIIIIYFPISLTSNELRTNIRSVWRKSTPVVFGSAQSCENCDYCDYCVIISEILLMCCTHGNAREVWALLYPLLGLDLYKDHFWVLERNIQMPKNLCGYTEPHLRIQCWLC